MEGSSSDCLLTSQLMMFQGKVEGMKQALPEKTLDVESYVANPKRRKTDGSSRTI